MTNSSKSPFDKADDIPRDGRLLSLILASQGIEDADDRVLQQLLDFSYRHVADVLTTAQALAEHATRSRVEKQDVELAIQMRKRTEFQEAPPRDYLASLAHELNVLPLPIMPDTFDIVRLPPAHQRLTEVNFDISPENAVVFSDGESEEEADGQAEDEDEDMEEVAAPETAREMDEDYDD